MRVTTPHAHACPGRGAAWSASARNGAPLSRDRSKDGVRNGPGSAAHHSASASCCAAPGTRITQERAASARDASLREAVRPLFTMSNSPAHAACAAAAVRYQLSLPVRPRIRVARVCLIPQHHPEPFLQPPPNRGGGGAPGGASLETSRARRARRHACEAWAVPRNRDAASRRSTVALSAQGPLPSPALPPDAVRRLHAAGRNVPGRGPGRPVSAVTSRGRRHTPLRRQDRLRRRPR